MSLLALLCCFMAEVGLRMGWGWGRDEGGWIEEIFCGVCGKHVLF